MSDKVHGLKVKKKSEEWKRNIGETKKGKKYHLGKTHSEETKRCGRVGRIS